MLLRAGFRRRGVAHRLCMHEGGASAVRRLSSASADYEDPSNPELGMDPTLAHRQSRIVMSPLASIRICHTEPSVFAEFSEVVASGEFLVRDFRNGCIGHCSFFDISLRVAT